MQKRSPWKTLPLSWLFLLTIIVMLVCCLSVRAADLTGVSKQDILKTVDHLRQLTKEAKLETDSAKLALGSVQKQYDDQGNQLVKETAIAVEKTIEAHNNAKQRDVLVYIFALITGFWVLSQYQNMQIPILPPCKWALEAGFFFLGFGAAYAFGRFALAWASHFIP